MKVYPLFNDNQELYAFEVPHYFLFPGSAARFFARLCGVKIVFKRSFFERRSEIHASFMFENQEFHAIEPFGDNSRIFVGMILPAKAKASTIEALISFCEDNWPGPISRAWEFLWRF